MACQSIYSPCLLKPRLAAARHASLSGCPQHRPSWRSQQHQRLCHNIVMQATAEAKPANVRMPNWEAMSRHLVMKERLESLSPREAQKRLQSGDWVIVDVRPPKVHEGAHIEGSLSAPLFQPVNWAKPDAKKYLRAVAFMLNGVSPVEENTDFLDDVRRGVGGKGVIFACEAGGTTRATPNFQHGKASRSLKGAFKALQAEIRPVAHLDGGVYGWFQAGLPMVGDYDKSNLGRTPNATTEPTGSYYEEAKAALEEKQRQEGRANK